VLQGIPTNLPVAILIVLHIDEPFGAAFADWLEQQTPHGVTYAKDGAPIFGPQRKVLMAPPGRHLIVDGARLFLSNDPERHSCKPSIDVLFESLARTFGPETLGCLLTGMGRDGALGLLQLRRAGAFTIAQDEATSTVYGMPREAALLGAADRILPLDEIGRAITDMVTQRAQVSK
jgi:two-component system chemotaxis response regulator CheB